MKTIQFLFLTFILVCIAIQATQSLYLERGTLSLSELPEDSHLPDEKPSSTSVNDVVEIESQTVALLSSELAEETSTIPGVKTPATATVNNESQTAAMGHFEPATLSPLSSARATDEASPLLAIKRTKRMPPQYVYAVRAIRGSSNSNIRKRNSKPRSLLIIDAEDSF